MGDLYLIYIHEIGTNYENNSLYEFIFTDSLDDVDGIEWGSYPASGNPSPPYEELIQQVGKIELDGNLIVAQNNEQFSMWDAVDGIIALGWEDINGLEEYPDKRLVFPYGMKLSKVNEILYKRDIRITYIKEYKDA